MSTPDSEFEALERRLRRVPPAAPSAALMTRLLAVRPPQPARRWLQVWLPLAAAAGVCVAVGLHLARQAVPTGRAGDAVASTFQAVAHEDYLFGGRELGVFHGPNGRPYRVVQCVGIGRQTWQRPADRALVECAFPEQRVLLVAMNTY